MFWLPVKCVLMTVNSYPLFSIRKHQTIDFHFDCIDPFQYEIVAVVANDANINSVNDLRGSRLCHPGYGLSRHWTDIMANYLESTMIARECEDDLSPLESKIKASSRFFGPSCKPGPWTIDPLQDDVLSKFIVANHFRNGLEFFRNFFLLHS